MTWLVVVVGNVDAVVLDNVDVVNLVFGRS